MKKSSQVAFVVHDHCWFSPFIPNSTFLIMKLCLNSTGEKQGKIWRLVTWWGSGSFVGASSFGGFLDCFGWFLLVECDFWWFQVVCFLSSQTKLNQTLYCTHGGKWLTEVIRFFLIKVKKQGKYCCLVA